MDLSNLPEDIAAQMTDDIARLQAKAMRLAEAAAHDEMMGMLPADPTLPIALDGIWLDRKDGGWSALGVTTDNNNVSRLYQIGRISDRKVTLATAWPKFVSWVRARQAVADHDANLESVVESIPVSSSSVTLEA